jgi:hypothetical protein
VVEDDERSKSCKSKNSRFSQISATEPQAEVELPQLSQSSPLNSN